MHIASLRLSWSLPRREDALRADHEGRKSDLWGYVQEDSAADAFLLAVTNESGRWSGHERFFITAADTASEVASMELWERYWRDVPIKEGKNLAFLTARGRSGCWVGFMGIRNEYKDRVVCSRRV